MANSIRTPRQGVTDSSRRIAQAVDDEEWQKFRVSLKGLPTVVKLERLSEYWWWTHSAEVRGNWSEDHEVLDCDVCIRVDNYIKALCRGGQLHANESLATARQHNFKLTIKR